MSERDGCEVVVAGAINTDLVAVVEQAPEAGETVTGHSFAIFGGGKGANQAVAASRSGASVALAGAVGDDSFGSQRRQELADEGIDLGSVVQQSNQSSGVALITVETDGENRIAYIPGPTLKITGDQIWRLLERVRPKVYLQPNEVPFEAAKAAVQHARALGAVTVLNAAPDPGMVHGLLDEVGYLIVNTGEAETLAGRGGRQEELVAELAARYGVSVVLTAGEAGVFGHVEGTAVHVPAISVDVVDTTGAGDTFCGAFAAQLAQDIEFEQALRWAAAAASLATTVEGAQPSIPVAAEIRQSLSNET